MIYTVKEGDFILRNNIEHGHPFLDCYMGSIFRVIKFTNHNVEITEVVNPNGRSLAGGSLGVPHIIPLAKYFEEYRL
jgi:hypothetical protein